jgi:predicted amidophosphoribosyltransferase
MPIGAWWRGVQGELACLEKVLLGRTRPDADMAVREALTLCGTDPWCRGCGRTLEDAAGVEAVTGGRLLCGRCREQPLFDGFVRLGRYASPLDRLVQRVKARAWHDLADLLGRELGRRVAREVPTPPGGWRVVPVPSPALRRWARGIDHTDAMARGMCSVLAASRMHCLRARTSVRQAALGRAERLQRVRMAWRGPRDIPRGIGILLLDDIRTTGSTLHKARELLVQRGAGLVVPAVVCVRDDL